MTVTGITIKCMEMENSHILTIRLYMKGNYVVTNLVVMAQ